MIDTRKRAVLDMSVYSALSLGRRNLTVDETVAFLRKHWRCGWAPTSDVVTRSRVRSAAKRLQGRGLIQVHGKALTIPMRKPDGLGFLLAMRPDRRDFYVVA